MIPPISRPILTPHEPRDTPAHAAELARVEGVMREDDARIARDDDARDAARDGHTHTPPLLTELRRRARDRAGTNIRAVEPIEAATPDPRRHGQRCACCGEAMDRKGPVKAEPENNIGAAPACWECPECGRCEEIEADEPLDTPWG